MIRGREGRDVAVMSPRHRRRWAMNGQVEVGEGRVENAGWRKVGGCWMGAVSGGLAYSN